MRGTFLGFLLILTTSALAQDTTSAPLEDSTPIARFQAEMRKLDLDTHASVAFSTNESGRISCTIHCANEAERVRVRDALIQIGGAAQSTKEPPTVSGILPSSSYRKTPNQVPSYGTASTEVNQPTYTTSPRPNSVVGSSTSQSSRSTGKDVYVRGYTKKDGTYVQPHTRSRPSK